MDVGLFELQQDVSPGDWVADAIHALGVDVGSLVPEGFEAYARVLHPAYLIERGADVFANEAPVRWSDIAAMNGRTVHRGMQWPNISGFWENTPGSSPGLWSQEPGTGSLPWSYAIRLAGILGEHTETPSDVWFCVWHGWARLTFDDVGFALLTAGRSRWRWRWRRMERPEPPAPTVNLPGRGYYLLSGPIRAITDSLCMGSAGQSANLWWPEDRSWFVATEIDMMSTYIGGSTALIEALLEDPGIETFPAEIDDPIWHGADDINPKPPPLRQ